MQVKWLRRALQNLDEEADYMAKNSPQAASDFVRHVRASVAMLVAHPDIGRPGRVAGTRELVINRFPYIVPYRVRRGEIEVLRVFHTARKWPPQMNE